MENNPPRVGKFKEMIVCKSDGSGPYRCDFCKRGFSNAQALGGHMNVHRKDRAKLRQYHHPEDDDHHLLLSPDMAAIRKNHPFIHLPRPSPDKLLILPQLDQSTEDDKDCTLKRQLNLSLFSDQKPWQSSSDNYDQRARRRAAAGGGRDDHHRGSSQKELDLELRLGLQPPQKTSASGSRYDFL